MFGKAWAHVTSSRSRRGADARSGERKPNPRRLRWRFGAALAGAVGLGAVAVSAAWVHSLGPAPRVRDVRSGKATGRLEEVLDGHLEAFLAPPA